MSRRSAAVWLISAIFLCSLSAAPVRGADVAWSKGDSWTYSWVAVEEGMFQMNGSLEMKVSKVTTDSYLTDLSGTATVAGSFDNMSLAGTATISGSMTRAKSNFSVVSTILSFNVTSTVAGFWVDIGAKTTAGPPVNDLPINMALTPGMHFWTNATVTGVSWTNMPLFGNSTSDISTTEHLELLVGSNESVVTPAGTFECVKLSAGSGSGALTYYYSEQVGNYVKVAGVNGTGIGVGAIGNLTLISYTYGKSQGIMSFITGKNWWVTALIIVVLAVVVIGMIAMRRRGRASRTAPNQTPPPPPPT